MSRRPACLLTAALVTGALCGAHAPTAEAAKTVGEKTNRYGKVYLSFTTDPGWMIIRMDTKASKYAHANLVVVRCRTRAGKWQKVAGVRWVHTKHPGSGGPGALPEGSTRCRIHRGMTMMAELRMRQVED